MTLGTKTIFRAAKTVLANASYRLIFFVLIPVAIFLLISIPVETIPGNSYAGQFSLYRPLDYAVLAVIASLISLLLVMHAYNFKKVRELKAKAGIIGAGGVGGLAATAASIFGAASCPMCAMSLFGFLGFGAVVFLLQFQWWIFGSSLLLLLASLYFISRKVNNACGECH